MNLTSNFHLKPMGFPCAMAPRGSLGTAGGTRHLPHNQPGNHWLKGKSTEQHGFLFTVSPQKKNIYYPHIGCFLQHFLYVPIISNSKSGKDLWTLSGQWYGLKHAEDSFQASDNQCHGGSTWRMWRIWGPGWPPAVPAHFGYKGIAQYHRPDRFMARNGARHLNHETAKNVIDCVWIYLYIYILYIYYIYILL